MPIRVVAQRSSEDIVHILSSRPLTQWALCGVVVGHDWLVRHEDVELSRNVFDVCGPCRRTLWKHLKNESRDFPLQEKEVATEKSFLARFKLPFGRARQRPLEETRKR